MDKVKLWGSFYNIVEIENKGTSQVERSYVDTSCSVEKNLFFQLKAAISFLYPTATRSLTFLFLLGVGGSLKKRPSYCLQLDNLKIVTIISAQATPGAASHQARL